MKPVHESMSTLTHREMMLSFPGALRRHRSERRMPRPAHTGLAWLLVPVVAVIVIMARLG